VLLLREKVTYYACVDCDFSWNIAFTLLLDIIILAFTLLLDIISLANHGLFRIHPLFSISIVGILLFAKGILRDVVTMARLYRFCGSPVESQYAVHSFGQQAAI